MADTGDHLSLAFQFVASFCWAIGALLAEPASVADFLQFGAAVAWCVANFAGAWSMGWLNIGSWHEKTRRTLGEDKNPSSMASSQRDLLASTSFGKDGSANGEDAKKANGSIEMVP